jgi:hypothetical protein
MTTAETIILKNLKIGEAESLPDIIIKGKEKRTIGRSTETMIATPTVSREHCKEILQLHKRRLTSYNNHNLH